MAYTDEDKRQQQGGTADLNSAYASASSPSPTGSTSEYDDDMARMAREGNYTEYLQKQFQLNNIRRQAQKNQQATLQSQGLANSGEGNSMGIAIQNAYANQQQSNLGDYYNTERNITSDAYSRYKEDQTNAQTEAAARTANIGSMLQQAATINDGGETFNRILAQYQEEINGMSGQQASDMNSMIDLYRTAAQQGTTEASRQAESWFSKNNFSAPNASGENAADTLKSVYVKTSSGERVKAGDGSKGVTHEIDMLVDSVGNGTIKDGDIVLLSNKNSRNGSMFVVYSNGGYYVLTPLQAKDYAGSTGGNFWKIEGEGYAPREGNKSTLQNL